MKQQVTRPLIQRGTRPERLHQLTGPGEPLKCQKSPPKANTDPLFCIVNPITRAMGPETVQGCDRGDQAGPLVGHNALIGPPTAPAKLVTRPREIH